MEEYISKSLAVNTLEMLRLHYQNIDECSEETVRECRRKIEKLKTEDVAMVHHGKWHSQEMLHYQCSVCGEWCSQTQELYEYCPHCGARMDG